MKVFLLGFMGSGKTHWGRIWAERSGQPFYDLDQLIEARQNSTINHLFETIGEAGFRELESAALHSFAETADAIIACGGGTPCYADNMDWMLANGITVYLSSTPQAILSRVQEEQDKRPLLKKVNPAELLFFIEQKLKEREPFYSRAGHILPVTELNPDSLLPVLNAE